MFKKKLLFLMLLLLTNASTMAEKDISKLLQNEYIGDFKLDMSGKDMNAKLHCSLKLGNEEAWGADGFFHQTWACREQGVQFDMVSDKKGGEKTIVSITITAPSKLKTKQGIHIGSSERDVSHAYGREKDSEASTNNVFVAGSAYGGLVFQFQNGKVASIFLGASAE
jgi:hypothetical protein